MLLQIFIALFLWTNDLFAQPVDWFKYWQSTQSDQKPYMAKVELYSNTPKKISKGDFFYVILSFWPSSFDLKDEVSKYINSIIFDYFYLVSVEEEFRPQNKEIKRIKLMLIKVGEYKNPGPGVLNLWGRPIVFTLWDEDVFKISNEELLDAYISFYLPEKENLNKNRIFYFLIFAFLIIIQFVLYKTIILLGQKRYFLGKKKYYKLLVHECSKRADFELLVLSQNLKSKDFVNYYRPMIDYVNKIKFIKDWQQAHFNNIHELLKVDK